MKTELAKEFKGQFECLGESTKKYLSFSVPIKQELNKLIKKLKWKRYYRKNYNLQNNFYQQRNIYDKLIIKSY